MAEQVYLAVDLGASSGRHVAGRFDGQRLMLDDVHRFENGPVHAGGHMYWDMLRLWTEIRAGLRAASTRYGGAVQSVAVDTWGVDFALLGRGDELLGNPYHYRDPRTVGLMEATFQSVSREEIFAATGLQFMELNSLFQLVAMQRSNSPLLEMAQSLLMMPDLFHWLLCGEKANEQTNATTTQFYDPRARDWARPLLEKLNIPTAMLGTIVPPGTTLGALRSEVADFTGLAGAKVVLPGTHDTASAVVAVPLAGEPSQQPDACYISSGTWSLMGVEVPEPVINDQCRELNFTNEGGVGGTTRLLKNIAGLWLVQECRRIWKQAGRDYSWDELVALADAAPPLVSLVDPDHPGFVAPADMPEAIRQYCRDTSQPVPESEGATIRCVLESLALRYRLVLGLLEQLTGGRIETIHIVGGGTQNTRLCQMAADATARRVLAGPVEATAIGNLMVQAVAAGQIGSIAQARQVVRHSFPLAEYTPEGTAAWDEAFRRFEKLL